MYVDILILSQLMHRDKHGYEIKKNAEKILGNIYSINNNSLYPVLRQFEEMGAINKHIEPQEGKPSRHVYSITLLGKEILADMLRDYPDEAAANDYEFYTRVGLFDLIDSESRKVILERRKKALASMIAHFEDIAESNGASFVQDHVYALQLLKLLKRQKEMEIGWIDGLLEEDN